MKNSENDINEIGSIDDIKKDIEDIRHIMENYSGIGQIFDGGFNDVVSEVGTYDSLQAMKVSSRVMPTHISSYVSRIYSKYENLIESRSWGLLNLYNYLNARIGQ